MKNQNGHSLTKNEQLDAICWAAKKAGSTYGQFSSRLTSSERDEVFTEYLEYITQKAREEEQRLAGRGQTEKS